jgi:hypothetical protein
MDVNWTFELQSRIRSAQLCGEGKRYCPNTRWCQGERDLEQFTGCGDLCGDDLLHGPIR